MLLRFATTSEAAQVGFRAYSISTRIALITMAS
jgi:hypothetical protein